MNAGWTFGHYPPCKFLLLGFPEKRLIRDGQKEGGGGSWVRRRETVETKTETSSSLQPEELWCWVQKRDETKSHHLLLPPPTFPKEKEKKGEEGERGEERSKWEPDARCTVVLFGLGAVGMMTL